MKKVKRYLYIDILNIFACLCVIFMHCNGIAHNYSNTRIWKESMAIETIAYWAVPVFFMISGAMLIGYREKYSTISFFRKRVTKTFFPFIIWILINMGIKVLLGQMKFPTRLSDFLSMFNNTTTENVYWFFIPLFMIYLSIPVLSLLKENRRILLYMTFAAFLTYSVYPVSCLILKIQKNEAVQFPAAGGYLLFALLGYLLSTAEMSKKVRTVFYVLGLFGIAIRFGTTVLWSQESGMLNQTFWGYMNFPAVFLACAVFVAAKSIKWEKMIKGEVAQKRLSKLAGAGFGVYLIHMIVFRFLQHVTGLEMTSYLWRFVMPFVIYFLSVSAVLVMKRVPLLKHIVP